MIHRDLGIQFGVQQYTIEYWTAMIFGDSTVFSPCKIGKTYISSSETHLLKMWRVGGGFGWTLKITLQGGGP